jgi:hypothetical protein
MNKRYLGTALVSCAIALNAVPVGAKQNTTVESSEPIFVCATEEGTPTIFTRASGETKLTPIMSWYSEYLLPDGSAAEVCLKTAAKLQDSYQQEQVKYLKSETTEQENSVCLVEEEDANCLSDNSQKLFSVNPNYSAGCVLENKKPIECKALQVRGIYSFDDKPYQALWWPW